MNSTDCWVIAGVALTILIIILAYSQVWADQWMGDDYADEDW